MNRILAIYGPLIMGLLIHINIKLNFCSASIVVTKTDDPNCQDEQNSHITNNDIIASTNNDHISTLISKQKPYLNKVQKIPVLDCGKIKENEGIGSQDTFMCNQNSDDPDMDELKFKVIENIIPGIIYLRVTQNELDIAFPWQNTFQRASATGVIVGPRIIATNRHVTANNISILASRERENKYYPARIIQQSDGFDLAFVTVDDDEFWIGSIAQKLATDLPNVYQKVYSVGYPAGNAVTNGAKRSICFSKGHITGWVTTLPAVNHKQHPGKLYLQMDTVTYFGSSGGPIIDTNGNIIGLASIGMRGPDIQKIKFAVPSTIIIKSLEDMQGFGRYGGTLELGFKLMKMMNNTAERYFKLPQLDDSDLDNGITKHGCVVTNISVRSMRSQSHRFNALVKKDTKYQNAKYGVNIRDVILSVNGYNIGADCLVNFKGQQVHFHATYNTLPVGEFIPITLLRDGKVIKTFLPLQQIEYIVPDVKADVEVPYFIYGGLVFLELSKLNIDDALDTKALDTYQTAYDNTEASFPGERIVQLRNILGGSTFVPGELCHMRLIAINDIPVINIKAAQEQIRDITKDPQNKFVVFLLGFVDNQRASDRHRWAQRGLDPSVRFIVIDIQQHLEQRKELFKKHKIYQASNIG